MNEIKINYIYIYIIRVFTFEFKYIGRICLILNSKKHLINNLFNKRSNLKS